jgi:hypothetical protein
VAEDAVTGSDGAAMACMCREAQKIFSDDEEAALVSFVRDSFTALGLIFTDSDFRDIAMNAFLTKDEDAGPVMPMFQCSAGFISMFKTCQ